MRSADCKTASKILITYLIFSLSGCPEGLKNRASQASSPSSRSAPSKEASEGDLAATLVHNGAVRELYDLVNSESQKLDDEIHFLRLMNQTSDTMTIEGLDHDAQLKK